MTSSSLAYRGRVTAIFLMLFGLWGALIPFVGPYFHFGFTPEKTWAYTSGRLWLSVVPGAAAVLGGLLIATTDRAAVPGAFLAVLGGAWFVVGVPVVATFFSGSSISAGTPVVSLSDPFRPAVMTFVERLSFFYGLGVMVLFLAALAFGEVVVARMAALRYHDRLTAAMDHQDEYDTSAY